MKLNVNESKQSDNAYLIYLRPECSAPVISEMNKTSYQTFKGSPAEPEVQIPFKTQTFPYVITFRLMLQATKKNTKELPAHIKTPV